MITINKPAYASFAPELKFLAIQSIIAKYLTLYPKAICSYSGGSDSDILIHLLETTRKTFNLPKVDYVFYNTGLEMEATKRHVKETAEKYQVEIKEIKPKISIVEAARKYGIPIFSKLASSQLRQVVKKNISLAILDEYANSSNKPKKYEELCKRYEKSKTGIKFICGCNNKGEEIKNQLDSMPSRPYLREFMMQYPIDFEISDRCCYFCKKQPAKEVEQNYTLIITGERYNEGGVRSIFSKDKENGCFTSYGNNNQYKLKPLYYVTNADKQYYKELANIRYSDAYEVYGLKRTGCCGCPIPRNVVANLEKIKPYEPNLVKAAWAVFGKSYEYRMKYNAYKKVMREANKTKQKGEITNGNQN